MIASDFPRPFDAVVIKRSMSGRAFLEAGDLDQALAAFDRVRLRASENLRNSPDSLFAQRDSAIGWDQLGYVHQRRGDYIDASVAYSRADTLYRRIVAIEGRYTQVGQEWALTLYRSGTLDYFDQIYGQAAEKLKLSSQILRARSRLDRDDLRTYQLFLVVLSLWCSAEQGTVAQVIAAGGYE